MTAAVAVPAGEVIGHRYARRTPGVENVLIAPALCVFVVSTHTVGYFAGATRCAAGAPVPNIDI